MNRFPVFIGRQANKTILTGTINAEELVKELRSQTIAVNPDAQRSLAKGAYKESTAELLEGDTVHKTLRMKELVHFLQRVMEAVKKGETSEGFFGCLQLAIPADFTGATVEIVGGVPDNLPSALHDVLKALPPGRRLGVLNLQTRIGEAAIYIGDGQGRAFGFHSLERMAQHLVVKYRAAIKKKEKAGHDVSSERRDLDEAERELAAVRTFLAETEISFVCYAAKIMPDGKVVGIDDSAQKRQYIEGNALNSRASQEEMVKYEHFSPVIVFLHELREYHDWMGQQYIEEDSKTISASSAKVFTLSALAQAFSLSVLGSNKPLRVEADHFETTEEHRAFVEAFWKKISDVFGPLWVPRTNVEMTRTERVAYLNEHRGDNHRNVAFQATFLMALGRLCYQMGLQAKWDHEHPVLGLLEKLSPDHVNYNAANPDGSWNKTWTNAMMKQAVDPKSMEVKGYVFNNTRENVVATYRQLAAYADFVIDDAANADEEVVDASEET
jgi:hypothetical protein